uniref:ribbon-helix-helix protein, CopG family n=1 Tax=Massilia sp. W12 TaxID=3126507 RepID=UPI00403F3DEA
MNQSRNNQLAKAQTTYRERLKGRGYRRIQEWVPEQTFVQLRELCRDTGLSQRELIEEMIRAATERKFSKNGAGHE